ncbi:MAG: pyridoxamine 5-phosphate oxidase-like protein FMN-binding protein [Candidatus Peribacteria bacterium]|nr:pyridoxamine 5-phosphate oxidase-like protein FMN-binding protein [Candidatus Peribacteria bacterium]
MAIELHYCYCLLMGYKEKARQILNDNLYCTIATSTLNGTPWISPVFFAYDETYNIFWISSKEAKHSALLKLNPQAAIVIFDSKAPEGKGDAVYMESTVTVLTRTDDIERGMNILGKRVSKDEFKAHSATEVTGENMWRIYKAVPNAIYTLSEGKYVNGQYIDTKVLISL